ncbi:MAG: ABC transporter substrate-binding protein [Lachnoclostridium sp.]|nr:ABC transporter substrate-binding protein [Lachnospira sp.]MCM1247073.1 ABC transporter substrate-binding protein [Lachnoclostridium sp.]MCM1534775.1 ABC transporter substrate-binding protein [Clostridium sp.]
MKKGNLKFRTAGERLAALGLAFALACAVLTGCNPSGAGQDNQQNIGSGQDNQTEKTVVRIGSLKGPTSMGLLFLMEENERGESLNTYEFQMSTGADELLPLMVKGELDIALVPANVAGVLYNKTQGGVTVLDVNTLGVLYMVSGDTSLTAMSDLKGKSIYLTGKGTTPDYVLQYLLSQNDMAITDCTLEYKSEAAEVAAVLAQNPDAVGLLPQPFVTAACAQNEELSVILDMNEEWNKVQGEGGSSMVTGVTVVRNEFLEEEKEAVELFLQEHAKSTQSINDDPGAGAVLAVKAEIIAKEPIAQKAIPKCNIVCVTGEEMKQALSGYLRILFEQSPEAVGGAMPEDGFYYVP